MYYLIVIITITIIIFLLITVTKYSHYVLLKKNSITICNIFYITFYKIIIYLN